MAVSDEINTWLKKYADAIFFPKLFPSNLVLANTSNQNM